MSYVAELNTVFVSGGRIAGPDGIRLGLGLWLGVGLEILVWHQVRVGIRVRDRIRDISI
jgi:hypothetical protein